MDIKTLVPGVYQLLKPIPNPKPDRRQKGWANLPEIPAGVYVVRPYYWAAKDDDALGKRLTIIKVPSGHRNGLTDPGGHRGQEWQDPRETARWDTIVAHLEPRERIDAEDFMALHDIEPYYVDSIFDELIAAGKITLDDIKVAYDTYRNRPDPDDVAPTTTEE